MDWYSLRGHGPVAIKYLTDLRLLFYWKRLPGESFDGPQLRIDDHAWPSILESLAQQTGSSGVRPMVLPVGLTVKNVFLDGHGHLAIRAVRTEVGEYTSGCLKTEGRF
jgi:hypothetical protein